MNKVYLRDGAIDLNKNKMDVRKEYSILFAMSNYAVLDVGYGRVANVSYKYIKRCKYVLKPRS